MFKRLARWRRERRAIEYLKLHPEDEPAVKGILFCIHLFDAKNIRNVRQVADTIAGTPMTDENWTVIRARWERAWYYIMGISN